jgi:hypothetical protein
MRRKILRQNLFIDANGFRLGYNYNSRARVCELGSGS